MNNAVTGTARNGINLEGAGNNTVVGNAVTGSARQGIQMRSGANNNTVRNNTVSNSDNTGILLLDANNNSVYNNNFINNFVPVFVAGSFGNIFNLAKPAGGNYWSNWRSPDDNDDGFVDSPYVFAAEQDNLPWAVANSWLDTVAPTTTPSLAGTTGNNGWYTSDVQVTLTANDSAGGTGIKKTRYSYDNANWNSL